MIIADLQYFPPVTFFNALYTRTHVYFDLYEHYRKMSFRNRCMIAGAHGIISLSVPLQGGRNQRSPMHEVLISEDTNWRASHFKSIQSSYNRSPFFEHYQDELAVIYSKPFNRLWEWNLHCLNWVKGKLEWHTEIRLTEAAIPFQANGIDDLRNSVLPKNYGNWNALRYRQVFEERTGFFPNLSILDLLFNKGKEAAECFRTIPEIDIT